MFLKHDNTATFDSAQWNWARSSVCDDAIFVASCVCEAAKNEFAWPDRDERLYLTKKFSFLPGCIGFIVGTLWEIRKLFNNPEHKNWFNGSKKMYCFNNNVIIDPR